MPVGQRLPLIQALISAMRGQPHHLWQIVHRQLNTFRHIILARLIMLAMPCAAIHQLARHIGVLNDIILIVIQKLDQTARAAAIAQRFPFFIAHFVQRIMLPELGSDGALIMRNRLRCGGTRCVFCIKGAGDVRQNRPRKRISIFLTGVTVL